MPISGTLLEIEAGVQRLRFLNPSLQEKLGPAPSCAADELDSYILSLEPRPPRPGIGIFKASGRSP